MVGSKIPAGKVILGFLSLLSLLPGCYETSSLLCYTHSATVLCLTTETMGQCNHGLLDQSKVNLSSF